jgi:hypothetical protein
MTLQEYLARVRARRAHYAGLKQRRHLMNTRKIADEMGDLKAAMAPIEERFNLLKEQLMSLGEGLHEGKRYDVRISYVERTIVDPEELRRYLAPDLLDLVQKPSNCLSCSVRGKLLAKKAA